MDGRAFSNRLQLACFLFLLCGAWAFSQQSPIPSEREIPLAEIARQSRRRNTDSTNPVRLITNADLKFLNSNVSTGSTTGHQAINRNTRQAQTGKDAAGSEFARERIEGLRRRFEEARNHLVIVTNEAAVLQLRMNHLRNAYFTRSDGATQQRIQHQIVDTQKQIEQNRAAQAEARSAVRVLSEEAREKGLPARLIQDLTGKLPEEPPEITTPESG